MGVGVPLRMAVPDMVQSAWASLHILVPRRTQTGVVLWAGTEGTDFRGQPAAEGIVWI